MQVAPWISAFFMSLIMGAPYGHTFTQVAPATQFVGSTLATCPGMSSLARESTVAARPQQQRMRPSNGTGECAPLAIRLGCHAQRP